jgi:hypothetical protein
MVVTPVNGLGELLSASSFTVPAAVLLNADLALQEPISVHASDQ